MNTVKVSLLLLPFLLTPTNALLSFPDNVDFNTMIYNSSDCYNTTSVRSLTLSHMCFDTSRNGSHPQCCMDLLSDIYVPQNAKFGDCLTVPQGSIRYSCNTTNFNHFTTEETLGYIGLVLIILNAMALLCYCGYCCCKKRSGYNRF